MNKDIVIDKLTSLVPVWGYYRGKGKGFEEGMAAVSQKYKEIYADFQDELVQYNRDVFGKEGVFVTPEGWDEQYWCDLLDYFLDGNDLALTTRQIFFAFTKAFLQKMDEKNLKTLKGAPPQRQSPVNFVFKYVPTCSAFLVISVAAVPSAIVSSRLLFASFIAEEERVRNCTMSSFETA